MNNMRKRYHIKNLDCANCALKIENAFKSLEGVQKVKVDITQELVILESSTHYEAKKLERIAQKIEDGVLIHDEKNEVHHQHHQIKSQELIINIIGFIIFLIMIISDQFNLIHSSLIRISLYLLAYIMIGGKVLYKAIKNMMNGQVFDEHFLMSIATLGAFFIGEYVEGVAVMLFYRVGEFLQDLAVDRSKKSIKALLDIKPTIAHIEDNTSIKDVTPESLMIDQIIYVYPGEKIPVDGVIIQGKSSLDTSKLTGESLPRDVIENDHVLSGSINLSGVLKVKVEQTYEHSTVAKIIAFAQNNIDKKAKTEQFITKFAKYYTPVVVFLAVVLAFIVPLFDSLFFSRLNYQTLFPLYLKRSLIFLVISCPCALVLSIPLSFFSGIGASSKQGILVKSGSDLEALSQLDYIVFDKTGTLTKGTFEVIDIVSDDPKQTLYLAAHLEAFSTHPIAKSITKHYQGKLNQDILSDVNELFGQGLEAKYQEHTLYVGNEKLMREHHITCPNDLVHKTVVHVALNDQHIGYIVIDDQLKEHAKQTINALNQKHIQTCVVTGDKKEAAKHILNDLNVEIYANCLPEDKVNIVRTYMEKGKTAFIGDGINDAPVLIAADLGIAMGGLGSDAAIEASDAVIMNDDPYKLIDAIDISQKTMHIVKQNIVLAIGIKMIVLVLGALGYANMWLAIFADVGVSLLAVFNALRIFKYSKKVQKDV
ncbi:MAG: cadmium-translocating P-type ATPase [Bacillota bacterium]|nr:MAG: cadmium-translocating P-type ATPase [Bacillota bacterium]